MVVICLFADKAGQLTNQDKAEPPSINLPTRQATDNQMPLTYTTSYIVQTYDINKRRRMTVAALVKLMQEAAMQNVMQIKLSLWDLEKQHISWVLLRKNLRINRLPNIGERLKVCTYPVGFEKVFTFRDYKVFDEKGELIAYSSSSWLLLDTRTRRMSRIPQFILDYEKDLPPKSEWLPRPASKIPVLKNAGFEKKFRVNWHDLDFNGHLNNVYYLQWMLETVPDKLLESGTLKAFDIQYKLEGMWKDSVISFSEKTGPAEYLHKLVREGDGKELATGRSEWASL